MDEEEHSPVLDAVADEIHIVPYTKRDRRLNYFIAVIVVVNLAIVLGGIILGFFI